VRPSGSLVAAAAAVLALAIVGSAWPALARLWQVGAGAAALLALLDLGLSLRLPAPGLERRVPGTLPIGAWTTVRLRLRNALPVARRVRIFDDLPPALEAQGMPRDLRLPPRSALELQYRLRPVVRGAHRIGPAHVQIQSLFGLWWRAARIGEPKQLRIHPNFATLKKYALLRVGHRLAMLGVHLRRRRGEGSEFHQLREFREGDSLRQIDWKATSRVRRLVSREYQDERDQQVILLLDCGRRMRALERPEDGHGLPMAHFDHVLDAALLLAYVALKEGDAVGLLSFAGQDRWLAPRKGPGALNALLEGVFDLQPTTAATDYLAAAQSCLAHHRKRSLVVLLTALRDEDDESLLPALELLRRRHRVLLASLRERELDEVLAGPVQDFESALLHGATHQYLLQRRLTFERIAAQGVRGLDLRPEQLPMALVNRYFELKRGGAA
jgi:uncharacterized protein (DUF58 family)